MSNQLSLAVKVLRSHYRTLNLEKKNKHLVLIKKHKETSSSYPYKAGWKPAFTVQNPPPPPLLVGSIHYFNDIAGLESQLLVIHRDMVPEGFCIHHTAITDELWTKQFKLSAPSKKAAQSASVVAALAPLLLSQTSVDNCLLPISNEKRRWC